MVLDELFYWKSGLRYKIEYSIGITTQVTTLYLLENALYHYVERSINQSTINSDTFYCKRTNITISYVWLCDGHIDCKYGEDENVENCVQASTNNPFPINGYIWSIIEREEGLNKLCDPIGTSVTIPDMRSVIITHSNYPQVYKPNTVCSYVITVSLESVVKLYVLQFLLPDTAACSGDSFKIYDGSNITSPSLGTFCRLPNYIPMSFVSTGSEMFIKFKADSDFNGNYLLMVRSIQQYEIKEEGVNCFTYGHGYQGTQNTPSSGTCENWPTPSLFQYPTNNFVRQDGSFHNHCRQMVNDLPNENFLTPQCYQNGTVADCELSRCMPVCSIDEFSCVTGECLPMSRVCDRTPDCPLRDDEHHCPPDTPLINFSDTFIYSSHVIDHNLGTISWTFPIEFESKKQKVYFLYLSVYKNDLSLFHFLKGQSHTGLRIFETDQD